MKEFVCLYATAKRQMVSRKYRNIALKYQIFFGFQFLG